MSESSVDEIVAGIERNIFNVTQDDIRALIADWRRRGEELETAREDYRALKESYDTACDCAAVYRKQRDSARALLRLAFQALLIARLDHDLRARIDKELG